MVSPRTGCAAAALALAALLGSTAGTGATWVDRTVVPGDSVRTAAVVPPRPTCNGLAGLVSWDPVPGATSYVVQTPLGTVPVSGTSYSVAISGLVTVRAVFGSWVSAPASC